MVITGMHIDKLKYAIDKILNCVCWFKIKYAPLNPINASIGINNLTIYLSFAKLPFIVN